MEVAVRALAYDDLPALAELHVKTWQHAYASQMEQSYLDSLDIAQRLKVWQQGFADMQGGVLVATAPDDRLAGFLSYNPPRAKAPDGGEIEIRALYTLKPYWSQGVGYSLYRAYKARHRELTYLYVLKANHRAITAYKRWGGVVQSGETPLQIGGMNLRELCVIFKP